MTKPTALVLATVLSLGALSACAASPPAEETAQPDENVGVVQSELYRDPGGGTVCTSPKPTCVDPTPEPLGQLCCLRVYCDIVTRTWQCTRTCVPIDDGFSRL